MEREKYERAKGHVKRNANDSYLYVYTDDERAFMLAVERYKRERHRPFPTWAEVYAIALCLGYRLVAPPMALPKRTR